MGSPFPFFDMLRVSNQFGLMTLEAQKVIAMRLMGMAGAWNTPPSENHRMVAEKTDAMIAATAAMTRAMARGASPVAIAMAGLRPVRARTRANSARLSKRGPS